MELETLTPISDEARALAQSKKVTIEPLHDGVAADDVPDSVIVANHLREGAIANASNDIEQDTPAIAIANSAPSLQSQNPIKLYVLTGTGFVALATVIVIVILSS